MNRCGLCFVVEKDEMRRRRRTKSVMHGRGRVASPCRGARTLHEGNCDFALCAGFCFSPTLSPSPCWRSFSVSLRRVPHNIYPKQSNAYVRCLYTYLPNHADVRHPEVSFHSRRASAAPPLPEARDAWRLC